MTAEEAKKFFQEQKDEGQTDDEILGTLYAMFVDDSINLEQLEALVNVLGYEITDEFKNMSPEDQKTKGWDDEAEEESKGMTAEEARDFLLEQRENGASDNEILGTLYEMFVDDVIDVEELGELVSFIGYELTEEFKNMSPEDQKTKGWDDEAEEEIIKKKKIPSWLG